MSEPQNTLPDWSVDRWFNTPEPISLPDLRGTPSVLILDRTGVTRTHHFGQVNPLRVGAEVGMLGSRGKPFAAPTAEARKTGCTGSGCEILAG